MKKETYVLNEEKRRNLINIAYGIVTSKLKSTRGVDLERGDIYDRGVVIRFETNNCGCCPPDIDEELVTWEELGLA